VLLNDSWVEEEPICTSTPLRSELWEVSEDEGPMSSQKFLTKVDSVELLQLFLLLLLLRTCLEGKRMHIEATTDY
jgi:hypothetical protein